MKAYKTCARPATMLDSLALETVVMSLSMTNAPLDVLRKGPAWVALARPARRGVAGISFSVDSKKEKQIQKQRRKHDSRHEDDKPLDEARLDEDSVIGEAERPMPPSEKPESRPQ